MMSGLELSKNEFYIPCKGGVGAGQRKHSKRSGWSTDDIEDDDSFLLDKK